MSLPEGVSEQPLRKDSIENSADSPEFGIILRSYRQRQNLSLRATGRLLGVAHSTLSQIEFGKRKPPHTRKGVQFLDKLKKLPGITEEELSALLTSKDIPQWLSQSDLAQPEQKSVRNFVTASVPGMRVTMYFDLDANTVPVKDQTDLEEIIRRGVQLSLRGYLRQKEELAKLGLNEGYFRLPDADSLT